MNKVITLVVCLLFIGSLHAQKVKFKKGKVLVDKKEYLTYDKKAIYSLDGVKLFTLEKKELVEEDLVRKSLTDNSIQSDIADKINRTNDSDNLGRADNRPRTKKTKYFLVTFARFKLEFETTLSKSKIIKELYQNNVVNAAGLIDQEAAKKLANRLNKNISGTRIKVD